MTGADFEGLLRELAPQVLGTLVRRYGQFEGCEDAVQEALLAASVQWPGEGVPDNPRGWLATVASRRLIDQLRSDHARRERESATAAEVAPEEVPGTDDTLVLLFLCCHPTLTAASQTALTLRAVGGLTTAEIARAFLVPEGTMAARISRAKQRIKAAGSSFRLPDGTEREERLRVVLQVLYLIFNEGYTASSGRELDRADLAREAIRLTRMVHAQLPEDGEVAGLLALMLLTHARRAARTTAAGDLVPLDEQDRATWDRALIDEGIRLTRASLARPVLGPYQLQAAIAATHADAATAEETNCRRCTPFTWSWSGSHRTRWSPSTGRSRSPRPRARRPGWPCCPRWTATSGWPGTTGCCRCGRTCWRRAATRPARTSTTCGPRRPPPASLSSAIFRPEPPG